MCNSYRQLQEVGVGGGTGRCGAGLARFLFNHGITAHEVNRPNRMRRRLLGKSDFTDTENAARAVPGAKTIAKQQTGQVAAIDERAYKTALNAPV